MYYKIFSAASASGFFVEKIVIQNQDWKRGFDMKVGIRKRTIALLMALFVVFSSTLLSYANAERAYAAGFLPAMYTAFECLQWLFLSSGVTITSSDSSMGDKIVDEISASIDKWCQETKGKSFFEIVGITFKEVCMDGFNATWKISIDVWNLIREYIQALTKGELSHSQTTNGETSLTITDGYDVVNYFSNQVTSTKVGDYYYYFENSDDLNTVAEYCQKYGTENFSLYVCWLARSSGLHSPLGWALVFGEDATQLGDPFSYTNNSLTLNNNPQYVTPSLHILLFQKLDAYGRVRLTDSTDVDSNAYVSHIDISFDNISNFDACGPYSGYYTKWLSVCKNGINSPTYEKQVARAVPHALAKNVIEEGNYDVISIGQTKVGEGSVTISIPNELTVSINGIETRLDGIDDAIARIEAGTISAADVLELAGVIPVDVVAGESVYEYADEEGNSAVIPLEQVLARLDELAKEDVKDSEAEEDTESDLILNDPGIPTPAVLPEGITDMLNTLKSKFPFCIPFDMVAFVKNFQSNSPKDDAPVFTVSIPMPFVNYVWEIKVDLSDYWEYVKIFRFGLLATFIIGLMFSTRKLISWQLPS